MTRDHTAIALGLMLVVAWQRPVSGAPAETAAPPVRVAVAAAGSLPESVKGYLLVQLEHDPRLRLVDPFRVDAILGPVMTPVYDVRGDFLRRHLSAFVQVDVLVHVADNGPQIGVTVATGAGVVTQAISTADATARPAAAFGAAAAFVWQALHLPPGERAPNSDISGLLHNPDIFAAYYRCLGRPPYLTPTRERLLRQAARPGAAGDVATSYECLESVWTLHRDSVPLSARKLYGLHLLTLDAKAGFSANWADAGQALVAVLGTPLEPVAYPLLAGARGGEFETLLRPICATLLPLQEESLDALIEDGAGPDLPALPETGKGGEATYSAGQRLGAIRALGCIPTPSALQWVLGAAAASDPATRAAAAVTLASRDEAPARAALRKLANDADPMVARAALPATLDGEARLAALKARFRNGDVDAAEAERLLLDDDTGVVLEALRHFNAGAPTAGAADVMRRLASDPDTAVAEAARMALLAHAPDEPAARLLLRLECGSPYDRLSVLAGMAAARDMAPAAGLLERGMLNTLPLIRFESLRLMGEHYADRVAPLLRAGLADPHRWVRMQAAVMAADRPAPDLADAIAEALAREASDTIRIALQTALAKATGGAPPAERAAAHVSGDDRRLVWTDSTPGVELDDAPIEGYLCKFSPEELAGRGKPIYRRTLWGTLPNPEHLLHIPAVFDKFWSDFDAGGSQTSLDGQDGCDLRLIGMGGGNWDDVWRDFCRDAEIDPLRVDGNMSNLTVFEKRAFDTWMQERCISGFNLLYDLVKLQTRFKRPRLQVSTWSFFDATPAQGLRRWKCDLTWLWYAGSYRRARMFKTLWPDRPHVYGAPAMGETLRYDSPLPAALAPEGTNRFFRHALLAWLSGAHLEINSVFQFVDARTGAADDPQAQYVAFNSLGPYPAALDKAIDYAFANAPIAGAHAPPAPDAPAVASGNASDAGLEDEQGRVDPAAALKKQMRLGLLLLQKNLYDAARIFESLPRFDAQPETLLIGPTAPPPLAPQGTPSVNAGAELAYPYDYLPDINLVAGHDLSPYRLIVTENVTLLRDETIERLSTWLRETPGLLLIHQDLTADNSAEASTPADHDGLLRADWPWERDLVVHPASEATEMRREGRRVTTASGTMEVTADTAMSHADCLTAKATALAQTADKTVLACWRDAAYRGAVLFDGLRSPSAAYVDRLTAEINTLAAQGIGRAVSGRPGMVEAETECFQMAAPPDAIDAPRTMLRLSGIDLLTGAIDPEVGPGTAPAIVPRADYFHRYLACTPTIVALGEREFSEARKTDDGALVLRNAGLVQLAARGDPQVSRQDSAPLPALPFELTWVLVGGPDGVTRYQTLSGSRLTFVRCDGPVVVRDMPRD